MNHTVFHVETFAGQREVAKAYRRCKLPAAAFEAGGGFLAAPVCSSWVWLSRSTSKRTKAR
eukprot:271163-Alexandrium_andersonii.AAC.1